MCLLSLELSVFRGEPLGGFLHTPAYTFVAPEEEALGLFYSDQLFDYTCPGVGLVSLERLSLNISFILYQRIVSRQTSW